MTNPENTTPQLADQIAWARIRLSEERSESAGPAKDPASTDLERGLLQPMSATQAEELLDRVLAKVAPDLHASQAQDTLGEETGEEAVGQGASVLSLDAARGRLRRFRAGIGAALSVLAAAAALVFLVRSGPEDPQRPQFELGAMPIAFEIEVLGRGATMRGDPEPGTTAGLVFLEGERVVLALTPFERSADPLELRVFAVQGERRIPLSWRVKIGDKSLGDREIEGTLAGLEPGDWRLEVEASDPSTGSIRWRDAVSLRIAPQIREFSTGSRPE